MSLPHYITPAQKTWLFKVTKETGPMPERDLALLAFFMGAPCMVLEISRIQLGDVLTKKGKLVKCFIIRGVKAFNLKDRKVFMVNSKLQQFVTNYIKWRVEKNLGLGNHPDHYLGLDPDEALFLTTKGKAFSITKKLTPAGNPTYSADALGRHLIHLMKEGGIECPSILSGRRTFAITLKRAGIDIAHIHHLMGFIDINTTKKLMTSDPVDMGAIAKLAF